IAGTSKEARLRFIQSKKQRSISEALSSSNSAKKKATARQLLAQINIGISFTSLPSKSNENKASYSPGFNCDHSCCPPPDAQSERAHNIRSPQFELCYRGQRGGSRKRTVRNIYPRLFSENRHTLFW